MAQDIGRRRFPVRVSRSLSLRLFILQVVILVLAFSVYAWITIRKENVQILQDSMRHADRTSDAIRRATRAAMLRNQRENVYEIIKTMAGQSGIEEIHIYNKRGETIHSTEGPTSLAVDMQAEACYPCHGQRTPLETIPIEERVRFLEAGDGHRVMGLINPILNEPDCSNAACHAHPEGQRILGVVDVKLSFAATDARIQGRKVDMFLQTFGAILLVLVVSGLFVYFMVHIPVRKLTRGTQEIARGNLNYALDIRTKDEIGHLADSFNRMIRDVKAARDEARGWSETLEERVDSKTRQLTQMQSQILQAEKMVSLGRLAATVAHELNNPMTGILTYANLVKRKVRHSSLSEQEKDHFEQFLEKIANESTRCGDIVNNMLLFSRQRGARFKRDHLEQILDSCIELVSHHLERANIRVVKRFDLKDDSLLCDTNQLKQVFIAVFINGAEAMEEGGELTITTQQLDRGRMLQVRISDTGDGIPRDIQDSIFEPFFSTKGEGSHVGMGLSVAFGVMESHSGRIKVDSGSGSGTTFVIDLPVVARPREGAQETEGSGET